MDKVALLSSLCSDVKINFVVIFPFSIAKSAFMSKKVLKKKVKKDNILWYEE